VYGFDQFGYTCFMKKQEAIAVLLAHRDALRARGVRHAALFGSVARDDARADSDVDILIELEPEAELDLFAYVGLRRYIAGLFTGPVDVVDREALKPDLRPPTERDAVYAF
jgi:predicted nucleotidyltransferase